jgi:hypothetical protein
LRLPRRFYPVFGAHVGFLYRTIFGFLAGVVRKKLALTLQSKKTDGERVYRVTGKPDESAEPEAA